MPKGEEKRKSNASQLTSKLAEELRRGHEKFLEELSGLEKEQNELLREYRKKLETLKLKELERKLWP